MQIAQLRYLVALARERHFGRAAEACHVSQPTLSAGLQRLEEELGARLVLRGRRFEGLTAEGERVFAWAQRIAADVDGLQVDLRAMRDGLSGRLRIGAIPTSLPVVSSLSAPLCAGRPGLELSVLSMSSREIEQGLRQAELDAGITYLDNEPLSGVRTLRLYRERYLLLTTADEPLGQSPEVTWQEAAARRLCLLSPDMQNRRIVDSIMREAGAAPRPVLETNSISTLVDHVRAGVGCAIVAQSWLRPPGLPAGLHAAPLVEPRREHAIGLVWREREPEPLLARTLITLVRRLRREGLLPE